MDAWYGAFAPEKTPQGAVAQLADWFIAAMQMPEVKAKLLVPGLYPVGTCGAEFMLARVRQALA